LQKFLKKIILTDMKKRYKNTNNIKLSNYNQNDADPDDLLACFDNQVVHTPETIKDRCESLIQDAQGVIPGIRIVGLLNLNQCMALQMGSHRVHSKLMDHLSYKVSQESWNDLAPVPGKEDEEHGDAKLTYEDFTAMERIAEEEDLDEND